MWAWFLLPLYIVASYFIANTVHEVSHALIYWKNKYKVKFFLYPHKWNDRFYWGRYESRSIKGSKILSNFERGLKSFAPMLVEPILFFVGSVLFKFFGPTNIFALDLFLVVLICSFVFDALRGLFLSFFASKKHVDINKAIKYLKVSKIYFNILFFVYFICAATIANFWLFPAIF